MLTSLLLTSSANLVLSVQFKLTLLILLLTFVVFVNYLSTFLILVCNYTYYKHKQKIKSINFINWTDNFHHVIPYFWSVVCNCDCRLYPFCTYSIFKETFLRVVLSLELFHIITDFWCPFFTTEKYKWQRTILETWCFKKNIVTRNKWLWKENKVLCHKYNLWGYYTPNYRSIVSEVVKQRPFENSRRIFRLSFVICSLQFYTVFCFVFCFWFCFFLVFLEWRLKSWKNGLSIILFGNFFHLFSLIRRKLYRKKNFTIWQYYLFY